MNGWSGGRRGSVVEVLVPWSRWWCWVEVLVLWWRCWYPHGGGGAGWRFCGEDAGPVVEVVVLGGGAGPVVFLCPDFVGLSLSLSRAPHQLKDVAPGAQPPFLLYNKEEVKTDTNKIEEFLEGVLAPPE